MTIKAEQIYKEEWTKVDYLDFRDNLRGQGKGAAEWLKEQCLTGQYAG